MLGFRLEQPLRSFSGLMFRAIILMGMTSCTLSQQDPEEVAMTVAAVVSAGPNCLWDVSAGQLLTGEMDLISVASPGGAVGHSRRYPIGVQWASTAGAEASAEFGDSFITLKDVEVRLMYDDAIVAPPTDETRQNLPATYVVPTMGTQDLNQTPIAVFDLIPTWVAQRLALDRQIWLDTSKDSNLGTRVPAPGKGYLLATEFRLRGYNAGGKRLVSNWFRWVISLCRGCRMSFTTTPPARPAAGFPTFPGHYAAEDIDQPEPLPARPGVVTWCSAGVDQGIFSQDVVQPSQPLEPRTYE